MKRRKKQPDLRFLYVFTVMVILLVTSLLTFAQDNDDIYWTVYDADTVEEETNTYITNNYYTNYSSRISRFHRRPFYASYWSYHNPYWYSYYYPFYTGYYWGWYNPYRYYSWYHTPYYNYAYWYSYYPTYHYAHNHHHHPHWRTANSNKKPVVNAPRKVTPKTTVRSKPKYERPKYTHYERPSSTKYIHIETNVSKKPTKRPPKKFNFHPTVPNKTHPNRPKVSSPSRVTGPPQKVKMNPNRIQHIRPTRGKAPR